MSISELGFLFQRSVSEVVQKYLPRRVARAKRPWITDSILELISQRQHARDIKNWEEEKTLHLLIRKYAKMDRE